MESEGEQRSRKLKNSSNNMRLTRNFSSKEFDCADGAPYPKKWLKSRLKPLCLALEKIRALTDKPLTIHSGFRTAKYNRKVGGKPSSKHLTGQGCDFSLSDMTIPDLYKAVEKLIQDDIIHEGGLGFYPAHCHYDIRGKKARWRINK